MNIFLGLGAIVCLYLMVYYRLMVRYWYQKQYGTVEGTFVTLMSVPPYRRLDEKGRRYARRYWVAFAVMLTCVIILARTRGVFSRLADSAPLG